MKKFAFILLLIGQGLYLFSQNKMVVHQAEQSTEFIIAEPDSAYFNEDKSIIYFNIAENISEFLLSEIDSITFETITDQTVYITYEGESVTVINPLAEQGVTVSWEGADVTVNSTTATSYINYVLSGETGDGMFKIYSEKAFNLLLNGVSITNNDGPAINIQSGKKALVNLLTGTENNLTDGSDYAEPVGDEDQGATFFSEGKLVFIGSGGLTINSYGAEEDALRSDDYVQVDEGNITITTSVNDGIHGKDGVFITGGIIHVTSFSDGIDGDEGNVTIDRGNIFITSTEDDVKGIKCDSVITMNSGTIIMSLGGDQSKGLKSNTGMYLNGGIINIDATGGVVLEQSGPGYDPSYCTAIKCEAGIVINGSVLNLTCEGEAGRGLSSDTDITIESGSINIECSGDGAKYTNTSGQADAYHGSCMDTDNNMTITGGSFILSNSGSGGKGISVDGDLIIGTETLSPIIDITTTGADIYISQGNYDESKTIKTDGSVIINNGDITISSTDDGIKAEAAATLNGGNILIEQSGEGIEAPNITVNNCILNLYSTDDGFNATYGNGGEQDDGSLLLINGGYCHVSSSNGDPIDSNGDFSMTGGTLVVHGPQSSPEVGMDVNGQSLISAGFAVISGTNSNMTEGFTNSSTQYSLLVKTNTAIQANTIFHIRDNSGNDIVTFAPERKYYSIVFSSAMLLQGGTYSIYTGGTCTGTEVNGLYTGGTYSGGTLKKTFTVTNMVTNVNF